MATTTVLRRQRRLSGRWIAAGIIVLVAIVIGLVLVRGAARRSTVAGPATVAVTRGSLVAAVAGSGNIAAEQQLDLAFQTAGTVVEVSVQPGDTVKTGQVLARLDDRTLQVQVANAQSSLDSAKARLAQAQSGNARPEDLAAAKAQLAASQASYDKLANGPTAADLAAAQAAVASAQAAYDAANKSAGTSASQLTSAAATVAKTSAALKQAQAAYDQVASLPNIAMLPQSLQLQQATIDYQQAKANYDSLNQTSGTDAQSKVQSAASQLAQARANLAKLTPNAQDLAAAQGNLDQAKANLAKLTAPATATDLQIQQAAVSQAEGALKQAQLNLDNATLKAPFAGIVSTVSIVTGSQASSAVPALRLVNRNPLHVDLKLSENDVAQVALDQPVNLTIQSLGGWQTQGKVSYVAPSADTTSGVVTYAVRVNFPDNDPKVKVGMTADLSIVTARKDSVLLIPNTALLPKGAGHAVQVLAKDANGRPTTREVDVQTGLSDGTSTEVLSGLSEGEQIVTLPDNGASRRPGGAFFGGG